LSYFYSYCTRSTTVTSGGSASAYYGGNSGSAADGATTRPAYADSAHLRIEKGGEVMPGTLTRWDPFVELGELRSRFDRMFDEWLDGRERAWTPAIDVVRDDGDLVVRADLAGTKPEEVKIEVEGDILTICGEHRRSDGPAPQGGQ
jgi:Hsp20/alpha crystallin family